MNKATPANDPQAGFTLIEALIAIVILSVGLIAVTNLFLVAAMSNEMGNLTTATATEASETLERLKSVDYLTTLAPLAGPTSQGSLTADLGAANTTPSVTPDILVGGALTYHMYRTVPGVGVIRTRWAIQSFNTSGPTAAACIMVESQALGAAVGGVATGVPRLGGEATRSQFSSWRACTSAGCP